MEEIKVIYLNHRMRFDGGDVSIGTARLVSQEEEAGTAREMDSVDQYLFESANEFVIKGPNPILEDGSNELVEHLTYRLYGHWTKYFNRRTHLAEKQFAYKTFFRDQPYGRAGVIAYLKQAGDGNGLGSARARDLWNKFGADAIRIAREQPDVVAAAIKGMSLDNAKRVSEWLTEQQSLEACSLELVELLEGRGFPKTTSKAAIKEWGNRAAEMIRRDPYKLMSFRGCGFKRCDAMWLDLGLPADRMKRQVACAWYSIASDTTGNTWFSIDKAVQGMQSMIGGARVQPEKAMSLSKRAKVLAFKRTGVNGELVDRGGAIWVAEYAKANQEQRVAEMLTHSLAETPQWLGEGGAGSSELPERLSDHQKEQLTKATHGVIGSLGGRPGTGKTYTLAALVQLLIATHGSDSIAIAAPTGKAAVRISEAMQEYGVELRARTIHSLLGVNSGGGNGWSFKHCESFPLPYQFVLVDESSMIDTGLMCSLLKARAVGTHVLFIGDTNQLPPVAHGAPLRDLIKAGLAYGELTEVKRNYGGIVKACEQMADGKRFEVSKAIDIEAGENLKLIDCHRADVQIEKVLATLKVAKGLGFNPVWDCQVIVAVNRRSQLSRREVNKLLQDQLNPNAVNASQGKSRNNSTPFLLADKIVNTKNGFYPVVDVDADDEETQFNDKGEVYVANGELAEVVAVEEKRIVAKLTSPDRTIVIPRGSQVSGDDSSSSDDDTPATGCNWDLGYALSCHRCQGSEWPIAIVLVDEYPGARMICDRSWIYTAISRAKKLCVLVGKLGTAHRFAREQKIDLRKTFLRELIEREREEVLEHTAKPPPLAEELVG